MPDFEYDTENVPLSTAQASNASSSNSSNCNMEHYQAQKLERLLKMSIYTKQYFITKNVSNFIKSDVWSQKYSGQINVEELIVSAKTVGNNVATLTEQYLNLLKPVLKKQADDGYLCIAPDLWTDKHRKIAYIGLTYTFVNDQFKFETIDLCYSAYDEYDKTGASVYFSIRKQLKLFDLEFYLGNKKLLFISDRSPNIRKTLEGQCVLFWFGHRLNNVLGKAFYQIKPAKDKELQASTTAATSKTRRIKAHGSSDEGNSSNDDEKSHRTIEDRFVDPDDNNQPLASTTTVTAQTFAELNKYLRMSIDDQYKISNPLFFWQHHQHKLPYLAKLARLLYSIPATSACVEQQFSAGDLLINERRSSLNPDTVQN
ncbi:unnamed protein product, partial [Rotaria sp. Silwood2]